MLKAHRAIFGDAQRQKGEERRGASLRICLWGLRTIRAAALVRWGGRADGLPLLRTWGQAGLFDTQHQEDAHRPFRRHGSRREERPRAGGGATTRGGAGAREGTPSQPRETMDSRPLVAVSDGTAARYDRLLCGTLAGGGRCSAQPYR